ncbi:thiolase family protein [Bacteriovoracaceae bacterium]|nr:thiolase family protein [Bacteriovoracaceae bacterium]
MTSYILSATRTPIASFMGPLSQVPAPKLGAHAIKEAIKQTNIDCEKIDEVIMGNVIQAGIGQAPARQASIFAEIPHSVPCTTVNKVCGSGLQSVIIGSQSIANQDAQLVVCGGMENMSLSPHLMPNSRTGYKFGPTEIKDSMQWDGLWDVYSNRTMGTCAEECAEKYNFTREQQDEFAVSSYKKSQHSIDQGYFKNEISPITVQAGRASIVCEQDDSPFKTSFEKVPKLKPAFIPNGTITAANASSINDGAAALVIGNDKYRDMAKFKIVSYATHAQHPTWFTTAPVEAMKKCLNRAKMDIKQIDLFEINEAFSVVTLACMKELCISHERVNVLGGAIALGHPLGATGARLLVTLMNALNLNSGKFGMVSLCIGGGEGLAMIIEKL